MKRKLQVLAAISHNANLLVLDEPTAGLDVIVRDELILAYHHCYYVVNTAFFQYKRRIIFHIELLLVG